MNAIAESHKLFIISSTVLRARAQIQSPFVQQTKDGMEIVVIKVEIYLCTEVNVMMKLTVDVPAVEQATPATMVKLQFTKLPKGLTPEERT